MAALVAVSAVAAEVAPVPAKRFVHDPVELACPAGTQAFDFDHAAFCGTSLKDFHGPYAEFAPRGKVRAQGTYTHGARSGTWTFFDDQGVKKE